MLEMTASPRAADQPAELPDPARREPGRTRWPAPIAGDADTEPRCAGGEAALKILEIPGQAVRHPRRRAADGDHADDLRQPDRPQHHRRDASSATSSSRGVAAGAAIALFMPWCQLRRGNIIVDFFTAKAIGAHQRTCSTASARCCSALAMALLAWRTTLGGLNAWKSQSGTMMIGFPEWIVYAAMVPPLVLTARDRPGAGRARGFPTPPRRPQGQGAHEPAWPLTLPRSSPSCWC